MITRPKNPCVGDMAGYTD